jgi:hypothetical protein
MRKQIYNGVKKTLTVLFLVSLAVSLAATSAEAAFKVGGFKIGGTEHIDKRYETNLNDPWHKGFDQGTSDGMIHGAVDGCNDYNKGITRKLTIPDTKVTDPTDYNAGYKIGRQLQYNRNYRNANSGAEMGGRKKDCAKIDNKWGESLL